MSTKSPSADTRKLTDEMKRRIDAMSREDMARAWRFAAAGDPRFQGETGEYFSKRFQELGAFSPEISKRIGW
jgi:hypothetical protein